MAAVDHVGLECQNAAAQRFERRLAASQPAIKHGDVPEVAPASLAELQNAILPRSEKSSDQCYLTSTDPQRNWLLWQLADSAFPTGGFAHSGGLEAALNQGEIHDLSEMVAFVKASLCQFGHASLPFVNAAYDTPTSVVALDGICDSFITNHVANRASRSQGRTLLASAQRIFATLGFKSFLPPGVEEPEYGHLAPVSGVVLRQLGLVRVEASRLVCFLHLRGLISAAVRLGIVGPLQAQTVQYNLAPHAEAILQRCQNLAVDEIAQTAPLVDLWQANQDRLYSRLFQS
jgi:urease accessory protein